MNPEAAQVWFRVAIFITLVSAALLFCKKPDTAEFVITVTSLVIGLMFIAIVVYVVRRGSH